MTQPANLMTEIFNNINDIEHITVRVTQGDKFFGMFPSMRLPDFVHAELGMLRCVSWLYAMYQELGKPNVDFVVEKFDVYAIDGNKETRLHVTNVQKLRTLFQHNLDPTSQSDIKTRHHCEQWFQGRCNNSYPDNDEQWQESLSALLTEAKFFLRNIKDCIQKIEKDEATDQILQQWAVRRRRHHPQYEFERLISIVALDLGRPNIKPKNFSNRYYSQWILELEIKENYEFEKEARRLIERAILEDTRPQLPIDASDIMAEFSISPGRRVGDLLKQAMHIFDQAPCSKEELLQKLRDELSQGEI